MGRDRYLLSDLLTVHRARTASTVVLTPSGDVDLSTLDAFEDAIREELEPGTLVVIDVSGIGYLAAAGIRALIDVHRSAAEHGAQLVLVHPTVHVHRLLLLARAEHLLTGGERPLVVQRPEQDRATPPVGRGRPER